MSNEVTIEQMNEAIARFMGGVKQIIPEGGLHGYKEGTVLWMYLFSGNADPVRSLEFHTSWDWIVPVCKNIKSIKFNNMNTLMLSMGAMAEMNNGIVSLDLERTHKGAFQFLNWLNQQKQTSAGFDYKSRDWEKSKIRPASQAAIDAMKERWKSEGKRECPDCGLWFKSEGRCPECNPLG